MHDEGFPGRALEPAQPAQDLVGIRVRRQHRQAVDLGAHGHIAAMDLDRGGAVQHRRAARSLGLETGEQHRAARIGQVVLQMMDHAPAGGHAAGRHDDLGHGRAVQRLGLFHLGHIGRHAERRPRVGRRQALVAGVPKIDIDGAAGHRAVQEHRQVADDAPRLLELPDVEQRLRAPNRERGYHHGAAAPDRARDDGFQRVGRLLRAVLAVAIGGLDDQMIGLRHPPGGGINGSP